MEFHLSEAETKSSPLKAVAEVQKMMYTSETRDLWVQMSSDYFFSAVFLRSLYPFAPIRQSLLLKTQKFLRQQSTAAVPIPGSTDKHSLFTFAATYIQNIHDNSRTFVSNPNNPNKSTPTHHKTQVPITEVVVDTNLVVLNSLLPPVLPLLLLQPLSLLPLPLPPILARIHISTKARPSTQELSVPYLVTGPWRTRSSGIPPIRPRYA